MARPIGYDPKQVLFRAMNVFWEKGYEATSIQDIVDVTGLKPGSLYNVYGNKEGVFKAVLDLYSKINLEYIENLLFKGDDALENIEIFLNKAVVHTIANENTNGCLLVKTLLVVPSKDKKVQEFISTVYAQIEALLKKSLMKAVENGETKVDPEYFSKFIITVIYGTHVYHKINRETDTLNESVNILLSVLKNR